MLNGASNAKVKPITNHGSCGVIVNDWLMALRDQMTWHEAALKRGIDVQIVTVGYWIRKARGYRGFVTNYEAASNLQGYEWKFLGKKSTSYFWLLMSDWNLPVQ